MDNNEFFELSIEQAILKGFLEDNVFFSQAFPYFNENHFSSIEYQEIFKHLKNIYIKNGSQPLPKEVGLSLKEVKLEKLRGEAISEFKKIVLDKHTTSSSFLLEKAEEFVQKKECVSAILEGAETISKDGDMKPIYDRLGKALQISFNTDIGIFQDDIESRLNYYKLEQIGLKTGIASIDKRLGGGFYPKTLNVCAAVSHGGKSVLLGDFCVHQMFEGNAGVYYTLEMPEKMVWKRLDSNLLDIDINLMRQTPNEVFLTKFNSVKDKIGKLVVKEYPSGALDTIKIKAHLQELRLKYNFIPKYLVVDYLTLMSSIRVKPAVGPYTYYKMIAEELHALAKELGIPIFTAAQLNRSAYGNTDAGMQAVADSLGIAQTADTFFIITRTKEMDNIGQCHISFLKNRNTGDLSGTIIGTDFSRMKFFNLEEEEPEIKEAVKNIESHISFDQGLDWE